MFHCYSAITSKVIYFSCLVIEEFDPDQPWCNQAARAECSADISINMGSSPLGISCDECIRKIPAYQYNTFVYRDISASENINTVKSTKSNKTAVYDD